MKNAIYRTAAEVNDDDIKLSLYESFLIKVHDLKRSVRNWFSDHSEGFAITAVVFGVLLVIGLLIGGIAYLDESAHNAALQTTTNAARTWAARHHTTLNACERTDKVAVCQMADGNVVEYNLGLTIPTEVRRGE